PGRGGEPRARLSLFLARRPDGARGDPAQDRRLGRRARRDDHLRLSADRKGHPQEGEIRHAEAAQRGRGVRAGGHGVVMMRDPERRARGFTLLEVMVAVAILGLGLTAILSAQAGAFASAAHARHVSVATGLARCKMSEVEEHLAGPEGYPELD